jgi:hypothetical protein
VPRRTKTWSRLDQHERRHKALQLDLVKLKSELNKLTLELVEREEKRERFFNQHRDALRNLRIVDVPTIDRATSAWQSSLVCANIH